MLRLLAIPLFVMSGLPNHPNCPEKPTEPMMQQLIEINPEPGPSQGNSVFHSGAVARFGLNKTALRPQADKRYKTDYNSMLSDNYLQKDNADQMPARKSGHSAGEATGMVSPLTVNLFL
ncbi:hypothetical protein [Flavihumibacter fluvii]|uniref:hypothetical protein n=1 Tax=Flavihumibacter fluvii TaxID=2838157 RepID=UPI001BDE71B2|nr:hypothetical protein [Flavihumibacter fluvii]ULQ50866.1 hypothetical protein KJS93_12305 [Flavihumibacter fluvii]